MDPPSRRDVLLSVGRPSPRLCVLTPPWKITTMKNGNTSSARSLQHCLAVDSFRLVCEKAFKLFSSDVSYCGQQQTGRLCAERDPVISSAARRDVAAQEPRLHGANDEVRRLPSNVKQFL